MGNLDQLRQDESVLAQESETKLVLFHLSTGNYFSLNELGSRIWSLCDGTRSLSEIAAILASEYDAPAEVIEEDCRALAADLVERQLLMKGPAHGTA